MGFPSPSPDYLAGVRALCDSIGALYVADEVQTGLGADRLDVGGGRFGVVPDILVTGKGLSGGLYPIAATLLSERAGRWLKEDGWGNVSTFGGSELGCRVARAVLDITTRPETTGGSRPSPTVRHGPRRARGAARGVAGRDPADRTGDRAAVRPSEGGMLMTRACYDAGMWAMFAGFDRSVLQFKPGLLLSDAEAGEVLTRLEAAITGLLSTGILEDPSLVARMFSQVGASPGGSTTQTPEEHAQ